ncbi:5-hydroxytryptamine receptor 2A-like [Amphiura filiformis]|uniref:5-hydroxytryptamine receptor 2A-like n=1 Tax=Amphiura filiformis TaxID=82378 RepID=UPI003B2210F7
MESATRAGPTGLNSGSPGGTVGIADAEIYLSAVKIIIGIIGICGNMMVLIIMKIQTHRGKILICSQATIDMLTSIVFIADAFTRLNPPSIPQDPYLGYYYCLIWHYGALVFLLFALSTYNLVAISIERYILVLYPLYYRMHFSRKKEVLLGLCAWLVGPVMQVTYCVTQLSYKHGECYVIQIPNRNLLGVLLFVWEYFTPVVLMGCLFSRICVKLYKQDKEARSLKANSPLNVTEISTVSCAVPKDSKQQKYAVDAKRSLGGHVGKDEAAEYRRSRNITKTFVIIFVVYILCWSMNQFLFLQKNLGGYDHWDTAENYFANCLAMLNSACNPFIYVLHVKQYRDKVKSFFSCGN